MAGIGSREMQQREPGLRVAGQARNPFGVALGGGGNAVSSPVEAPPGAAEQNPAPPPGSAVLGHPTAPEEESFGSIFLRSLPAILTGPGGFAAALVTNMRQAESQGAQFTIGDSHKELTRLVDSGTPPQQAVAQVVKMSPPDLLDGTTIKDMLEIANTLAAKPELAKPAYQALSPGQVPGQVDPTTGVWAATGPAAPFAPAAQTNLNVAAPVTELERDKQLGRAQGDRMAAISVERQARKKRSAVVGMMSSMITDGRVQTGGGSRMAVRANELLGIDLGEDVDDLQAFDQLANTLILDLKAQQKGTQTDSDQAVIAATVPSINKSIEANKLAIEIITALDARLEEEARKEYELIENGLSPFAAENAVREHFGERPVFSDDMVARAGKLGGGKAPVPEQPREPKAPLSTQQLQAMSIEELEAYYAN